MLDIKFIRENRELVEQSAKAKGISVDIGELLDIYDRHGNLLREVEELRAKRNQLADRLKAGNPDQEAVTEGRRLKTELGPKEEELRKIEAERRDLSWDVPNIIPSDTPSGGEEANRQESQWGDVSDKDFEVVDHLTWGEQHGLIDFERGAKVAGNKFYYLKGSLVELEMAILQFGLSVAKKHDFMPMTTPHLVKNWVTEGVGFSPHGEERQIYRIPRQEGDTEKEDDLNLIATAEIPITGYHADEIIEAKDLPLLYAGLSPAYRMEAGAYGKHSKGLYRVHQFNKLELYAFCLGELAESEKWHKKLVEVEEEICQSLKIPYRLVRIAAGDLGAPAYKKYDIEYWSPVDKDYRELMSCSNVTDYQARRLNIRFRPQDGEIKLVHTLNGTAAATSRMLIAIIENYQNADGAVCIPDVLQPYMHNQKTI